MHNKSATDVQLEEMFHDFHSRSTAEVIIVSTAWGTLCVITLLGNLVTLIIVLKNRHLWTSTNLLIASLAASDCCFSVSNVLPLGTTTLASRKWPFSESTCQYQGFVAIMMAFTSTLTLGCTAFNRFYCVVKPGKYTQVFSRRNTLGLIVLIWFLAVLAPLPYLAAGNKFVFHPAKAFCYLRVDSGAFTAFLVLTYIGIPAVTICYCYLRVFLVVRRHSAQISRSISAEEVKITKILVVTVLVFVCCWAPILLIDVIDTARGHWSMPRWMYLVYIFLAVVSSSANPFIYGIMSPAFREEYLNVLRCRTCRRNNVINIADTEIPP